MSKLMKIKNTSGKALHKMSEPEIREMVIQLADRMLDGIPDEIRVSEINAVQLESSIKEAADAGAWAQWTRACCDKRKRIDDFVDPVNEELGIINPGLEKAVFQNHFDSNLSIRQITEPASLKKIKARRARGK